MTNQELNYELFERILAEQEAYKTWLLSLPPSKILCHAYEYAMREDIIWVMECHDLSRERAKALLDSEFPLSDIFKDFEKIEDDHEGIILGCIESRADRNMEKIKSR